MKQDHTNDAFLWYDIGDWAKYGYAIPNYGKHPTSMNMTVLRFVDIISKNLFAIMHRACVRQAVVPDFDTVVDISRLCIRARDLLASSAKAENESRMQPTHTNPNYQDFLIRPVPYFTVRNTYMKHYCSFILMALSDAMQHTENDVPVDISRKFAKDIGQYIQRVYVMMAVEILKIPVDQASDPAFTLTPEIIKEMYKPSTYFTTTENVDARVDPLLIPTEDMLKTFSDGIPTSQIDLLPVWPNSLAAPTRSSSSSGTTIDTSTTQFVTEV